MEEKNITHFTTDMDRVRISWFEQKRAKYEEMRFISRDVFGLLDMYNKEIINNAYIPNPNDKIIIINSINCDIGYEENVNKVVNYFINYFSDCIIVSQVTPSTSTIPNVGEVFRHIENVDGINGKRYFISNYGNIKDDLTMTDVPVIITEDGPRVGLDCTDDGEIRFYSVAYLMVKTFNSVHSTDKWLEEYERLCKQFESFGFVSINEYCQFEYSCAYIYPNKLGNIIISEAEKLINNKDSNE